MSNKDAIPDSLYTAISSVIQEARQHVRQVVNRQMVQAYWHVGRLIVEQEQQGKLRAGYGKQQLEQLSTRLQADFGKGFDVTNLRNMRRFYLAFPIQETVSPELSWSHDNLLARIEKPAAREWYLRAPHRLDFLKLQQFLQLGQGFAFIKRQQRIRTDDGDYFIDLVF